MRTGRRTERQADMTKSKYIGLDLRIIKQLHLTELVNNILDIPNSSLKKKSKYPLPNILS
jgi:hypothetical protein